MNMETTTNTPRGQRSAPQAPKLLAQGVHRTVAPTETLERARPFLTTMGITRIANVTGLDRIGIPVTMVCRPNARSLAVSQGKGLTLDAAKASGLMESIELWHAERIRAPLRLASMRELAAEHTVVDVAALPRLSVSRFHDDLSLLWIEARTLADDAPVWLPFETVHLSFTLPLPPGSGCFMMSSNGLASGNHRLEALSHALCELVERDASALFRLLDEQARDVWEIDLGSVDDDACRETLALFEAADIGVRVWEMTADIGIASFECAIHEKDPSLLRTHHAVRGWGCHPAREIALLRALTEAAQCRLTMIAGSRDDIGEEGYVAATKPASPTGAPSRRFQDVPTFHGESVDDDVAWEVERLSAAGLTQVLTVDLTRPDIGIPVIKAIVPGLEGSHKLPGYTPGARAERRMKELEQ